MPSQPRLVLPNLAKVRFLPEKEDPNETEPSIPNETELEKMLPIARSPELVAETEIMELYAHLAKFSLLVYDEVLGFGICSKGIVSVGLRPYSGTMIEDYIEMTLSGLKEPIRVVDRTTNAQLLKKLEPIIDLDWIDYNPETRVIKEKDEPCYAQRYLESMPLTENLYSLVRWEGKIRVDHMRITNNVISMSQDDHIQSEIRCNGVGSEYHEGDIESVEKLVQSSHPDALVLKSPLRYCPFAIDVLKPHSCLARIFEETYAGKLLPKTEKPDFVDSTIN